MEQGYPDPSRYGILPSYGLFARHVKNLSVDHVELCYLKEDLRPCVFLQDVAGADFDHLTAAHAAGSPIFVFKGVTELNIHQSIGLPDSQRTGPIAEEKL